jgi:hypothetical protein
MQDLEKKLDLFKSTKIPETQREQIRRNLIAFMESSERNAQSVRHINYTGRLLKLKQRLSMPAIILALVLAFSGGTVAAANTSLPGDALYPIKERVENFRLNLKGETEGKARLQLGHFEKRLTEAEALAIKGRLDADASAKVEANFDRHEQRLNELIAKLEAEGNTEAAAKLSSNLEAALSAHAEILARMKAKVEAGENSTDPALLEDLRMMVSHKKDMAARIRAQHEGEIKTEHRERAALGAKGAAQNKIGEVKRFIERAEARLGADAVAEAKVKVAEAERIMAEGNVKLEAKSFAEAMVLFHQAHRTAQSAKLLIEAKVNLGISAEGVDAELKVRTDLSL